MVGSQQERPYWTLYSPLLSILQTEQECGYLEEAVMASECGKYLDARAIFDHKLPPSFSIPMLAMQYADVLTNQGLERERFQLLKKTLDSYEDVGDGEASMERLLLELMTLDASYWAYGRMNGLLNKARQLREWVAKVNVDRLRDLEVGLRAFQSSKSALTEIWTAAGYHPLLSSHQLL